MPLQRNNDRKYLYKYLKLESAKLVIANSSLKAGCPLDFNDPFDVQAGMHFGFDVDKFPELLQEKIRSLVLAE